MSRICARLEEAFGAFRTRRPEPVELPYVYPITTYPHVRFDNNQVIVEAVTVATGVTANGDCEVLVLEVSDSEDEVF